MLVCACFGGESERPDARASCYLARVDSCSGDSICIDDNMCEPAAPRAYIIGDIVAMVPFTKTDGTSWDAAGNAPDLFVTILVNGTAVATTAATPDSFSARPVGEYRVNLPAGPTILIRTQDEDVSSNDAALDCLAQPVTAAMLRSRVLQCSQGGYSVSIAITPE